MQIYLYVKQHNDTGLKYFGKTTRSDPYNYKGSGKYWKRHLKLHGSNIKTLDIWSFDNIEECTRFALKFSHDNNIVESSEWANLVQENGLDGGPAGVKRDPDAVLKRAIAHRGFKQSKEQIKATSERTKQRFIDRPELIEAVRQRTIKRNTGNVHSPETRAKMSASQIGRIVSQETRNKLSLHNKGRKHSEETKAKMRASRQARELRRVTV